MASERAHNIAAEIWLFGHLDGCSYSPRGETPCRCGAEARQVKVINNHLAAARAEDRALIEAFLRATQTLEAAFNKYWLDEANLDLVIDEWPTLRALIPVATARLKEPT